MCFIILMIQTQKQLWQNAHAWHWPLVTALFISNNHLLGSHCPHKALWEALALNGTNFLVHVKPQGFPIHMCNSLGLYHFFFFYEPLKLAMSFEPWYKQWTSGCFSNSQVEIFITNSRLGLPDRHLHSPGRHRQVQPARPQGEAGFFQQKLLLQLRALLWPRCF